MSDNPPITMLDGSLVRLGPLRRELLDTYQRWFNDLAVVRTLAAGSLPMTYEAEEQWFNSATTDRGEAVFTIYDRENGMPIGNVGLHNIDTRNGTADFGIVIGETSAWNRGYGTDSTRLMLEYGFDVLGLKNIMLKVYSNNPAGVRAYEKAGFKRIGVRRSALSLGRDRADEIFMDAIPEDFDPSPLRTLLVDGPPRD